MIKKIDKYHWDVCGRIFVMEEPGWWVHSSEVSIGVYRERPGRWYIDAGEEVDDLPRRDLGPFRSMMDAYKQIASLIFIMSEVDDG
jgi:hypothetical protein